MIKPTKSELMKKIQLNNELHKLAHQCADECQRWANDHLYAEQYWRDKARFAAKNMHALALQLYGGRDA